MHPGNGSCSAPSPVKRWVWENQSRINVAALPKFVLLLTTERPRGEALPPAPGAPWARRLLTSAEISSDSMSSPPTTPNQPGKCSVETLQVKFQLRKCRGEEYDREFGFWLTKHKQSFYEEELSHKNFLLVMVKERF